MIGSTFICLGYYISLHDWIQHHQLVIGHGLNQQFIFIINCWFYLLYNDVFTTTHKHPLFMTPSYRTTFRFLAHVSVLQYSRSSNVLVFKRTLANISAGYPCIPFSRTQWVKNSNRPNFSNELKRVLAWPSS